MSHLARTTLAALAALALVSPARAVDVTLALTSATTQACHYEDDWYYGQYLVCGGQVAAGLAPATPQGAGRLEFDAAHEFLRGALSLEAYSINGSGMPAWSAAIERVDSYTIRRADQAIGPWPLQIPGQASPASPYAAGIAVTRFSAQDDFAGTLTMSFQADDLTQWQLKLAFTSIPGSGPPACLGERLLLDDDGDGETNARDAAPGYRDTTYGGAIDADGRTIGDFCGTAPGNTSTCRRLDFQNDEPLRLKPLDCRPNTDHDYCAPAAFFAAEAATPSPAPRTCLGFALVDDADGDGEPDRSDRCATTPAGETVDGDGCSALQFCAAQTARACARADFSNDEPGKKPRDCAKTRTKPRACTVF